MGAEQFMGLDVGRFITITKDFGRDVLPGVCWLTYFGPGAIAITGRSSFEQLQAHRAEHLADGYLVWAYSSASQTESSLATESEHAIKEQLGPEHFFDASHVSTDSLKTDEVTAARIEKLTNQSKPARR